MKIELNDRRLDMFTELKKGASGEELAKKFGVSRTSVWKFVHKLEETGYILERRPKYRIVSKPDPSPFDMALALKEIPGLQNFHYFREVDSTNRLAKEVENSAVFAETQSAGRGRIGRKWESQRGGLYVSFSLNLSIPVNEIPKLTLLAGVAVAKTLENYGARIKWPNDVLINDKKVSGILSEFVGEELSARVIIGIGINVKNEIPDHLRDKAVSLKEIDESVSITDVFVRLCRNLSELMKRYPSEWESILGEWKGLSSTIGKHVVIDAGGRRYMGMAMDIDIDGGLIIRTERGNEKIISGECFYTNY
ncbi:biotin--[acetyl-CoA-carboxylase] ligase [Geoglobus acetivorans]|uniref:Biotin-protein ligase n=1 Tax=Geoglobus acetivorans TaxID=565033 RepID=A0A0A7GFL0_GEOAI|nr:Biotin-protein ligase [Geoglobus acetivorans]